MKGMPFNFQGGGVFGGQISYWTAKNNNNNMRKRSKVEIVVEPCSVLYHRQRSSPSPPTSSLTGTGALSSNSIGMAALSDHYFHQQKWTMEGEKKEEWVSELQLIPPSIGLSIIAISTLSRLPSFYPHHLILPSKTLAAKERREKWTMEGEKKEE
ncbi:uncharacterized protein A4U43_C08F5830 [Asparagus officinalis]|nr:uncharacterized protein A4U43_C08F5830 [Asparagus officinalis]